MAPGSNQVLESYSAHADEYDDDRNLTSCWGSVAAQAMASLRIAPSDRLVVEIGTGTGHGLREVAQQHPGSTRFVGIEPAAKMLLRARTRLRNCRNLWLLRGRFEDLPLRSQSVDYLYSILAFHWTTDLHRSVCELARVLKPDGSMDLFFTGRDTGGEFTKMTTPIFLKYMGPHRLLASAGRRKHLTQADADALFADTFSRNRLLVEETHQTYYDDLDGHWSWWTARAAGHFQDIPSDKRLLCDEEIKAAIKSLGGDRGIPYTIHLLHVQVRR